jgi:hypothetical protein
MLDWFEYLTPVLTVVRFENVIVIFWAQPSVTNKYFIGEMKGIFLFNVVLVFVVLSRGEVTLRGKCPPDSKQQNPLKVKNGMISN